MDVIFEPYKPLKRVIPRFKAYFKCNIKGLIDLYRIIHRFKATEQNIFGHIFKAISGLLFSIFVVPN